LLGISIGFRWGNLVVFDIKIGRNAKYENYFPGRDGLNNGVNSFFKFQFFYTVKDDNPAAFIDPIDGHRHPFLFTYMFKSNAIWCIGHGSNFSRRKRWSHFNKLELYNTFFVDLYLYIIKKIKN